MRISLLEWFGEAYDSGPMGEVKFGRWESTPRTRGAVTLCFGGSLLAVGVLCDWIIYSSPPATRWGNLVIALFVIVLYGVAGYFIRPKPNIHNLGWAGGLLDNPFRYSDDWNRLLLGVYLFLWPGRFVAESTVDFGVMLSHLKPPGRRGDNYEELFKHLAAPGRNSRSARYKTAYSPFFKETPDPKAHALYQALLRKTQGDEATAERLIQHEQQRTSSASRAELIANAIARWEQDNR